MTAEFLLPDEKIDIPAVSYFTKLREVLGVQAELYTYMKIAAAAELLQMGFDETKIDGQSTLNIWIMILNQDGTKEVCFLECAGVLVGGTADEVATHIEHKFEAAAEDLEKLRELLKAAGHDADMLVPLIDGGLAMARLRSVMHDTCNTANATAVKLIEKITELLKGSMSEAEWDKVPDKKKYVLDFLCANHTRGLPISNFNVMFKQRMNMLLGSFVEDAKMPVFKMGGEDVLYAIRKLFYGGWCEYYNSDGKALKKLIANDAPEYVHCSLGRHETGSRQDGVAEACPLIYVFLPYLRKHSVATLGLPGNILSDTVNVYLKLLPVESYIHTLAIIWIQLFDELRALTNSNDVNLNPIELNEIYDKLFDYAQLMQEEGDDEKLLDIFKKDFRLWEKFDKLKDWYAAHDTKKQCPSDRNNDKKYHEEVFKAVSAIGGDYRDDWDRYKPQLISTLRLFWAGLVKSFKFTSSNYLSALDGKYSNKIMQPWQKELAVMLLAHNNNAESPFAVAKWFSKHFPSMNLNTIKSLTMAKKNNTFGRHKEATGKNKSNGRKAGAAITAAPEVRDAIMKLTTNKKSEVSILDEKRKVYAKQLEESDELLEKKKAKQLEDNANKVAKKLTKENSANEVVMVRSVEDMETHLRAIQTCAGNKEKWLTSQVKARLDGHKFIYKTDNFDRKFVKQGMKIRLNPPEKSNINEKVDHLKQLLKLMIEYDVEHNHYSIEANRTSDISLFRSLPQPPLELSSSIMLGFEREGKERAKELEVADDPEFEEYDKYMGKVFYDSDGVNKFYKVIAIEYDADAGFLASSLECDLEGVILESNYVGGSLRDVVIDLKKENYTLTNNMDGYSMDEMIEKAEVEKNKRKRMRETVAPGENKRRKKRGGND